MKSNLETSGEGDEPLFQSVLDVQQDRNGNRLVD